MSKLVIYAWSNDILVESWAVSPFKFQLQKVRDEYLGPGFSSMSPPHQDSKFWMKNNKNILVSAILRTRKRKCVDWNKAFENLSADEKVNFFNKTLLNIFRLHPKQKN